MANRYHNTAGHANKGDRTYHGGRTVPAYVADGNDSSHRQSMKLGGGGRFEKLEHEIAAKGGVRNPAAVAASIGRKKYGKKKFQKLAAAGR